jgi:hypothetical protein
MKFSWVETSVGDRARGRVDRPDLLDVVEGANLGAEQVDDHVPGVDQHPVAAGQAFDAGLAVPLVLERPQQPVGQGADMAVRAAGRDDQAVGDGALVLEVDEDDVLGLVLVQAFQDQMFQSADPTLVIRRGPGGGRSLVRAQRGFAIQLCTPWAPTRTSEPST